jgi:hypothetical protein
VADDQKVGALWRIAVIGGVDFLLSAVDADAQHPNQYAAAIRYFID